MVTQLSGVLRVVVCDPEPVLFQKSGCPEGKSIQPLSHRAACSMWAAPLGLSFPVGSSSVSSVSVVGSEAVWEERRMEDTPGMVTVLGSLRVHLGGHTCDCGPG